MKDICSSSPMRTKKLQINFEQSLTGECWIPTKNDSQRPRAKEKPQQDGRSGEIASRIKPYTCQRSSEGSNKTLCAPGPRDPTETEPGLCLSVSCRGTGQQWPATGAGALVAADLGHAACGTSPLGGVRH